jgi:predicted permease
VSGLAPALRGSRVELAESLHGGDGAATGGFRGLRARRLRDGLLVAEAAFAVLLLIAATLLARSFIRLTQVDAGYTPERVLTVEVYVPGGDAEDKGETMQGIVGAALGRTRALPGIVAAGASNMMPLDNGTAIAGFPSPWTSPNGERQTVRSLAYTITPGYAEAVGLRLKHGRFFTDADYAGGPHAWVVNEEFARRFLGPNPIGYRWTIDATADRPARQNEIVGIVGNTLKNGNDTAVQPEHYNVLRTPGRFYGRFEIAVRTAGDPTAAAPPIRSLLREIAPAAAVETVTLAQRVTESIAEPRFAMTILVTFAVVALALASVGLYGVLSYGVSQRRRELGLRAALGASRLALVVMVVREGLVVTGIGLGVGLVAAAALTRWMQGVLFGVAPLDPIAFAAAPGLLLVVAIAASLLPANRAAATDPAEALRWD